MIAASLTREISNSWRISNHRHPAYRSSRTSLELVLKLEAVIKRTWRALRCNRKQKKKHLCQTALSYLKSTLAAASPISNAQPQQLRPHSTLQMTVATSTVRTRCLLTNLMSRSVHLVSTLFEYVQTVYTFKTIDKMDVSHLR